jgi:diguanylate cyclase (GGDEF)-like protein/PAS domain S-box-containing protein
MPKARLRLASASPAPGSLHPAGTHGAGHPAYAEDRLATVAELAHVVTWEFELPAPGLRWLTPLEQLLDSLPVGPGFRLAPAGAGIGDPGSSPAGRLVGVTELGEALLAPIIEPVSAGVVSDSYELMQELQVPGGDVHQILVRAITTRHAGGVRVTGVIADVSNPGTASWVNTDVGQRLQLLVEHTPDGIIVHQQGVILYANPAALRFAGLETMADAVGKPMTLFVHPEHIGPVVERIGQLREPGDAAKGHEVVIVRPDGVEFTVEVVSVRTTWDGEPAFQVILRDVSERKRAEEAAKARLAVERRYAAAVAALEEGVVVIDHEGVVCAANDSATRILGTRLLGAQGDRIFTSGTLARRADGSVFPVDELPLAKSLVDEVSSTDVVIGVTDEDGNEQWLSVSSRPIGGVEGADNAAIVCSVSDITERKQLLDRLAWEARNDPLTGLANRSGFLAAVEDAMGRGRDERAGLVMLFFDLDRFKLVNDSLGHAVGDEVLLTVARRLRDQLPRAVSLSRLHGDEFAALVPGIADTDAAMARAEDLRVVLGQPFRLSSGRQLTVTPSIGLVRLADVAGDASELLQDADMAMLQAKTRGRGRVALFDAGLRREVSERLELEHDLRVAVATGEQLRLEYQPLASLTDGRILGFEALARWDHPEKGPLPPGLFIEMAEESDLIISLGKWVLEEGCRQLAEWRAEFPGARDAVISMNVSPRQLDSPDFMPALRGALEQSGLPADALLLEITESGLVSHDVRIEGILAELREAGVCLAIDDFGTGYSSLSYLKRLPVSYLKIDRAFVSGLGVNTEDERIVTAVTELSHGLGLQVIAEGIEERIQLDVARALGCDIYQGYLLARPARPRDIAPFFEPIA